MRPPNTIDFLRGVALLEILVNHVPGNALSRFTHRQYGWSDAAEVLIFLAGFALALRGGARKGSRASLREEWMRAGNIYVWHVLFTFLLIAVYFTACRLGDPGILAENGTQKIDGATIAGVFLLSHQLRYFDILPVYIAMALISPLVLRIARDYGVSTLLLASFAMYFCARLAGVDAPNWPQSGQWYFNPFVWQFMFVLGFVCGHARAAGAALAGSRFVFGAAVCLLVVSALSMLMGLPNQDVSARGALEAALWDKGDLGPMRIVHFLALALVVARLSGPASDWLARRAPWTWTSVSTLGRYSLHTFCTAALLSALGQIAHRAGLHGLVFDAAFFAASMGLLLAFVHFARARRLRAAPSRARPAETSSSSMSLAP
jgi:hypothetical protein